MKRTNKVLKPHIILSTETDVKTKVLIMLGMIVVTLVLLGAGHHAPPTVPPPDPFAIRLQVVTFDPLAGEPDIPAEQRLTSQADDQPTTYLIQFTGPVKNEWKVAVEQAGAHLYGYIPNYTFIARMDLATTERAQALPFVRWVGLYHPAYRMAPSLAGLENQGVESVTVTVQTLPDADLDSLAAQAEVWGGEIQGQAANAVAGYLRVSLPSDRLPELAAQDGVLWIEPYFEPTLQNDVGGGQIMRADEIRTNLGLYGGGQIVAVADSGLDVGTTGPAMSDDFEGRIVAGQAICSLGTGGRTTWHDFNGHGTHVAGSVLGSGQNSGSNPSAHQYSGSFAGVAPEAQLIFQAIDNTPDPLGTLECIPPDFSTYLFYPAYILGARIHTNSWGAPTGGTTEAPEFGGYTANSQLADWATWNNKNFLVLFSAGNNGTDANNNGVVDLDSISSPGTAKNVLTVGAAESVRASGGYNPGGPCVSWGTCWPSKFSQNPIASDTPSNNANGMAAFSSRGPTDDGRVKPDLIAPGTNIISARSHDPSAGTGWGVYNQHYIYEGGTSMSTPLTAGAAAVVREWLTTIKGKANPSSALMKAVLINGAADMSPGQYGTGGSQEIPVQRPNFVTGWGRVDLKESLDTRPVWLEDNTAGLSTGANTVYTITVDAAVMGSQSVNQLIQNGNFDTGTWTPWQIIGTPTLTDQVYHSAPYSAQLAGRNNVNSDYVYQQVDVPADATQVGIDFWYRVSSSDASSPEDYMCVEIFDSGASMVLVSVGCATLYYEPQGQWLNFQHVISGTELAPLLGESVLLAFQGWTNATNPSTVWIDDVSFSVAAPDLLRITLAWSDYPGELASSSVLVNDLDLEVIAPGGTHYYGNQGLYSSGPCLRSGLWDACNNVEGVIIPTATDGDYTVVVHGNNVPQGQTQPFALVAAGDIAQVAKEPGANTVYLPVVLKNY